MTAIDQKGIFRATRNRACSVPESGARETERQLARHHDPPVLRFIAYSAAVHHRAIQGTLDVRFLAVRGARGLCCA